MLTNRGNLTLEKWYLQVEVPQLVHRWDQGSYAKPSQLFISNFVANDLPYIRLGCPSFWSAARSSDCLLPEQTLTLGQEFRLPLIELEITATSFRELSKHRPPLRWRLFMSNAKPVGGDVEFEDWCKY